MNTYMNLNTLLDDFIRLPVSRSHTAYPPYNVVKAPDNKYYVELAVAGFSEDDISITLKDNLLIVEGKCNAVERDYIHKGIATREFKRQFTLAETVEVQGADMVNGLLVITLQNVIPEQKKEKRIQIGKPTKQFLTE